jgi:hypothetical protein
MLNTINITVLTHWSFSTRHGNGEISLVGAPLGTDRIVNTSPIMYYKDGLFRTESGSRYAIAHGQQNQHHKYNWGDASIEDIINGRVIPRNHNTGEGPRRK